MSVIVADDKGNIFIADSVNATERELRGSGDLITIAGQPGVLGVATGPLPGSFYGVNGLAIERTGILYLTSASAVLKVRLPNP